MTEPVRVLHVFGRLDRGGAETMLMNIYRNIDRKRMQFDFVIGTSDKCDFTAEIEALGGKIYCIPRFGRKNARHYAKAWNDFFKEHREYRIIHGHLRSTAAIYLSIARKYGLITIAHSHSTSSGKGFQALVKNILQLRIRFIADYMFACSNAAGIWLFGKKACHMENYYILNNAINVKEFSYDEEKRSSVRKRLGFEDKFVIGHVGVFKREKNHDFIIDVFKEVHRKCDQAVLYLVGDGGLRSDIQKKVKENGLEDFVVFAGKSFEISNLMQAMDVFLFPSLYEGLPVTLIEAQASGLPCLISDTISKEVSVTDLVEYVPLHLNAEEWAYRLMNYADDFYRRNTYNEIRDANYDIASTGKWIEGFYLRLLQNSDYMGEKKRCKHGT